MDAMNVDYDGLIPNNVDLNADRRVKAALEKWHPGYIDWWKDMGPEGFQESLVYLRTAVSVDPKGWAKFDYVKMPEYRWGILLAPKVEGRTIEFRVEAFDEKERVGDGTHTRVVVNVERFDQRVQRKLLP